MRTDRERHAVDAGRLGLPGHRVSVLQRVPGCEVAALDDSRQTPAYDHVRWPELSSHQSLGSVRSSFCRDLRRGTVDRTGTRDSIWLLAGAGLDRRRRLLGGSRSRHVGSGGQRSSRRSIAGGNCSRQKSTRTAGVTASIAILFVVIIALSGLGVVVVKALGRRTNHLGDGNQAALAQLSRAMKLEPSRSKSPIGPLPPAPGWNIRMAIQWYVARPSRLIWPRPRHR